MFFIPSKEGHMDFNLNLRGFDAPLAVNLRTEEVAKVIPLLTQQPISGKLIREMAAQGVLEVQYALGILSVTPSTQKKVNGRWRWDISVKPTGYRSSGT
jgi:hypothetical protein